MAELDINTTPPNPFSDESHLGKPINMGISGIQQVLRCIQGGTSEVRDLIFNECELLYECRACRNIFRSLANFIYHKREFCKKHFCESMVLFTAEDMPEEVMIVQPESPKSNDNDNERENMAEESVDDENPSSVDEIILTKSATKIFQPDSKIPKLKDSKEIAHSASTLFYSKCVTSLEKRASLTPKKSLISLKAIETNPNAMFQTVEDVGQSPKTNENVTTPKPVTTLAEVRQQIEESKTAIINEEEMELSTRRQRHPSDTSTSVIERLRKRVDCDTANLTCVTCKTRYQSVKTLDFHMRTVHSDTRIYYPCPLCKTSFVHIWSVMRHIITVHKKTKEQSYKMRDLIKSRGFRKNPMTLSDQSKSSGNNLKVLQQSQPKTTQPSGRNERRQVTTRKSLEDIIKEARARKPAVIFTCTKCGRSFARKSSKATHEKYCLHRKSPEKTSKVASKMQVTPKGVPKVVPKGAAKVVSKVVPKTASKVIPKLTPKLVPKAESKLESNEEVKVGPKVQPAVKTEGTSERNRPKRNAKKKPEADFIPLTTPTHSRSNICRPQGSVDKRVLQRLHMASATFEKKVMAIVNCKKLRCLKCNRRFSTLSNLRRHAAIHIGWNRYKCKYCDYQSYNRSDCRSHIGRNHLPRRVSIAHLDKLVVDLPPGSPPLMNLTENSKETANENAKESPKESPSCSFLPNLQNSPIPTVRLYKCNSNSMTDSHWVSVKAAAATSESNSPEQKESSSDTSSVQNSSSPSTPKKPKRSKEQCLYEGNEPMFALKTRSGSYPKADLFGRAQSKVQEEMANESKKEETTKKEEKCVSEGTPSTSKSTPVPTSPSRLKSNITSKFQKFIYIQEDYLPHLKSKSNIKTQLENSSSNTA